MPKTLKQTKNEAWVKDNTGKVRHVVIDKEGIARGDYVQPIGKDEKEFFSRYKHLGTNSKGEIINKEQDKEKAQIQERNQDILERDDYERNRDPVHSKKYF